MKYLDFFILLASLQGFLIAIIFAVSPLFKRKSSRYLGLLIFVVSLQNLSNGLFNLGHQQIEYFPLSFTILIPFSLYCFVNYFIDKDYQLKRFEKLMILFFFCQFAYKFFCFVIYLINPTAILNQQFFMYFNYLFEICALVFMMLILFRLNNLIGFFERELLQEYADIEDKTLSWLRWTLVAVFVLSIVWLIAFALKLSIGDQTILVFYFVWFGVSLLTYWLAYSVYIRRHIFEVNLVTLPAENTNVVQALSENTDLHHKKLLDLMDQEKLFQNPALNMTLLAQKMDLSKGYLSLIINQKEGKNFFEFVNTYRVEEIKKNINDPDKSHYSLLGIGMEAGFKSKSTFNSVFKKLTGQTPSQFKKSNKTQ